MSSQGSKNASSSLYWYFQPIIRIRLLSRLEQLTNLGFGEWLLSIYVELFLLSLYKNLMFIFVFVVVVCPPIFASIDVLFCEIDDLKSHTKILLWTDFVVERKTKSSIVIDSNWLFFLCLYEAPYDKKKSTHPLIILYFNNDPAPIILKYKPDPPMISLSPLS